MISFDWRESGADLKDSESHLIILIYEGRLVTIMDICLSGLEKRSIAVGLAIARSRGR